MERDSVDSMAAAAAAKTGAAAAGAEPAPKGGGKKKLLLILLPVLLLGLGAGLWFSGILPGLLGMGEAAAEDHAAPAAHAAAPGSGGGHGAPGAAPPPVPRSPPTFIDLPEIVANLNAPGRRTSFVRLRAKLEISRAEDASAVQAAMPRLQDLFQTYLREVRPEELRGSAGTHRLREELISRANLAAAPARITDVLFVEMLVQ
jgi:flagellar FliL protein